jgi:hypothetical protein
MGELRPFIPCGVCGSSQEVYRGRFLVHQRVTRSGCTRCEGSGAKVLRADMLRWVAAVRATTELDVTHAEDAVARATAYCAAKKAQATKTLAALDGLAKKLTGHNLHPKANAP